LSAISFVVVAQQMQNAVENQYLEFARQLAAKFLGIATSNRRRYRDIA